MTQTIYPALRYRDADGALRFLADAFGATENAVYRDDGNVIRHGQLVIERSMIMFGTADEEGFLGGAAPDARRSTISLYVVVAGVGGVESHCERAVAAGAELVRPLEDTEYGSREYSVRDPEGNLWSFGTYDPSAAPGD